MSKQDRQGARTATDLERKYNFGKTFAELLGLAQAAQNAAENAQKELDGLTAEEVFNILTDGGQDQGIYRLDGKIYLNATYVKSGVLMAELIKAGVLQSKDGKTFYLDLDNGVLRMEADELTISGKTVGDIAQDAADKAESNAKGYADDAAHNAVLAQTQEDIFNKLTNNGAVQGIYMENGDIFINATYIKSGQMVADLIKAGVLQSKDGSTFYLDLDNGVLKMNATSLSLAGQAISDVIDDRLQAAGVGDPLTQEDVFNILTNYGTLKGIFLEDGELYVNASYIKTGTMVADLIKAGILKSNDGETFYLDLENGILKGKFTEFSISGKTVDSIAKDAADTAEGNAKSYADGVAGTAEGNAKAYADQAAQAAVERQTQEDIFNMLTNNGAVQGLFLQDGQLYINAQYIQAGSFTSQGEVFFEPGLEEYETIKAHVLGSATIPDDKIALYDFNNDGSVTITDMIACKSAMLGKTSLAEWSGAVKSVATVVMDATNTSKTVKISGTNMWGREVEHYIGFDGANFGTHKGNLLVNGKVSIAGEIALGVNESGEPTLALGNTLPKKLSWKDNGDGTYTLIGEG